MTTQPQPHTHRIFIVEGQEYSLPIDVAIEAVREHLTATLPGVRNASIKKGTRKIASDGAEVEVETIEFVKQGGTKGLDHVGLARLVGTLPDRVGVTIKPHDPLLEQLAREELTFGDAVDITVMSLLGRALVEVSDEHCRPSTTATKENRLCQRIDQLPAVAGDVSVW